MLQPQPLQYPFDEQPGVGETLQVAPGIRWIRIPLPFVLDHINLWLLDDGDASLLVDTAIGFDSIKAHWEALLAGPCAARPIRRIFVTHCHPDHLGLAAWLARRLDAPIIMTQGEVLMAHAWWSQLPGHDNAAMFAFFRRHGLDESRIDDLARHGPMYAKRVPQVPEAYQRVIDGDELTIGGRVWRVVTGHGHSPEHAALYCEEARVLISGDMVLPRITTNISAKSETPDDDPLARYLDSLARLKNLPPDVLVLPSHGRPFRGLHARIAQLEAHHRDRCDELLAACREPRSAADLIPVLFRRELDTHQVMFAMGESIAHLNYLEHARRLRRLAGEDGVQRYIAETRP